MDGPNPFYVRKTFYKLARAVAMVTHEVLADSIDQSHELPFYCSPEPADLRFGAVGKWEDIEGTVEGAARLPPFPESILSGVRAALASGAFSERPYCRFMILPYVENSELLKKIIDPVCGGEVVAILKKGVFYPFLGIS